MCGDLTANEGIRISRSMRLTLHISESKCETVGQVAETGRVHSFFRLGGDVMSVA